MTSYHDRRPTDDNERKWNRPIQTQLSKERCDSTWKEVREQGGNVKGNQYQKSSRVSETAE